MPHKPTRLVEDPAQAVFIDCTHTDSRGTASNLPELAEEVSKTLRHELAHYFGISDRRLREIWPEGA